jgi:hypothetical protein
MPHTSRLLSSLLFLTLTTTFPAPIARAQQSDDRASAPTTTNSAKRETLVRLLEQTVADANALVLPENRVHIQATALTLLCDGDPRRTQELSKELVASFAALVAQSESELASDNHQTFVAARRHRLQARQEMSAFLQKMNAVSPKFAREILKSMRVAIGAEEKDSPNASFLAGLERAIALGRDKGLDELRQSAQELLENGEFSESASLLHELQEHDPATASQFVADFAAKLRTATPFQKSDANEALFSVVDSIKSLALEPADGARRQIFTLAADSILDEFALISSEPDAETLFRQKSLAERAYDNWTQINHYAPKQAAQLRAIFGAEFKTLYQAQKNQREYDELLQTGSLEQLVRAARDTKRPSKAERIISIAAKRIADQGDLEGAKRLVEENIPDAKVRNRIVRRLGPSTPANRDEQPNDLTVYLERLRTLTEKVQFLCIIAQRAARSDPPAARAYLEQALALAAPNGGRATQSEQLKAILTIGRTYAQIDSERSLEILSPGMEHLSNLIEASAVLGGFAPNVSPELKNGEIPPGAQNFHHFSSLALTTLPAVAHADLDRAIALTEKFQRPEVRAYIRIHAVESLAQTLLKSPPDSSTRGSSPQKGLQRQ